MTGMRRNLFILLVASGLFTIGSAQAQTYLAARGTGQVVVGDKTLVTLQDGVDYRVVGLAPNEGVYIATGSGTANLRNPSQFQVVSGGVYASDSTVNLKDVEATTGLYEGATRSEGGNGRLPTFGGDPTWKVSYTAQMISSQAMGHVYAVLRWLVDGEPVAIDVQRIGTLAANRSTDLSFSIPIRLSQKSGTYSLHVYSGYTELRQAGGDTPTPSIKAAAGADRPTTKLIGMSATELTDLFGPAAGSAPDPFLTGCIDLDFKASSLADSQSIMVHAEIMDGICLGISFIKYGGGGDSALTGQEIARWLRAYSQNTDSQWKQDGPKKWVLEPGSGVLYKYRAEWPIPNTFIINTQELLDRARKAKQQTNAEIPTIPGLSDGNNATDIAIPGLTPTPSKNNPSDVRIPGLPDRNMPSSPTIPGLPSVNPKAASIDTPKPILPADASTPSHRPPAKPEAWGGEPLKAAGF